MYKVVLIRHGESTWNRENRFTGWVDVDLTKKGEYEARNAGKTLRDKGFSFDITYTSVLKRAIKTLWFVLDEMDLHWIPTIHSWRLNERHYGYLQGLNKAEVANEFGDQQVLIWRRSFNVQPPPMSTEKLKKLQNDNRYSKVKKEDLPITESLKDTVNRVLPLWKESIVPSIKYGKKILISAHGNSIRALVKHLDQINDKDIVKINIPNGKPLVYYLDENLKPIKSFYI
tara:strand:- start:745 stop:1431 length:687 start_codon:yes stop_codon:yes gene_type:complete